VLHKKKDRKRQNTREEEEKRKIGEGENPERAVCKGCGKEGGDGGRRGNDNERGGQGT